MTKRIIDADALQKIEEWLNEQESNFGFSVYDVKQKIKKLVTFAPEPQNNKQIVLDYFCDLKNRIEAEIEKPLEDSLIGITADNAYLAGLKTALRFADDTARHIIDRPTPEPQEQVIDIYNTKINGNSIFYNLLEKIGDLKTSYGLKKIERTKEQKVSEMSLYNFIDYIFSGKYKKYEGVEFVEPQPKRMIDADALLEWVKSETYNIYCEEMMRDYFMVYSEDLVKKINELATPAPEPQQSIYDAEGWCWDIDKAPITIVGAKIKFFDILVTKKYHTGAKSEFKQNERITNVWLDDYLKLRDSTQEKLSIADIAVLAWRPLPTLPIGGASD